MCAAVWPAKAVKALPDIQVGKLRWLAGELIQQVWFRVTLFAGVGIVTAVAGLALKNFIPDDLPAKIGADAVEAILQILASSMLTVATFSLSILTAAYAAAGSTATPRSVHLLVADGVSQTVIATFIGAFVFSLVSLILLKTQIYGQAGRLILFGVTLLVVGVVVISLLRWIDQLGRLGRMGDTVARVAEAARESLAARLQAPWMGGNPMRGKPPIGAESIVCENSGHLQHCDMKKLSSLADEHGLLIYVMVAPGDFLHPAKPALRVENLPQDAEKVQGLHRDLRACLTVGQERNFNQDPLFGLTVLSEIAQRALSPSVNDPGTAIEVVEQIQTVLIQWRDDAEPVVEYPRLYVQALVVRDMLEESLVPIARDGADNHQVQRRLQQTLLSLNDIAPHIFGQTAADLSRLMMVYADKAIVIPAQRQMLQTISDQISDSRQTFAATV